MSVTSPFSHISQKRKDIIINLKKPYHLFTQEELCVKKRKGRKPALGIRISLTKVTQLNQIWRLNFISNTMADWGRFRILSVIDQYFRECVGWIANTSLLGERRDTPELSLR